LVSGVEEETGVCPKAGFADDPPGPGDAARVAVT